MCRIFPPLGSRLKKTYRNKYAGVGTTLRYRGLLFEVVLGELLGDCLFFHQLYEPYLESCLLNALHHASIFVDVGANIGIYSLLGAKLVDRVLSVEPSPTLRKRLIHNIQLNKIDNVTICDWAITDRDGDLSFYENLRSENMEVGRIFHTGYPGESKVGIKVKGGTLDTLAFAYELFRSSCVIKIDIEGAELRAINGGEELLGGENAPILFIEIHPPEMTIFGGSNDALFKKLTELRYRIRDIVGFRDIDDDYLGRMDLFTVICTKSSHEKFINLKTK